MTSSGRISVGRRLPRRASIPRMDLIPSICSSFSSISVTLAGSRLESVRIMWTFDRPKSSASFLFATANFMSWGRLSERV